MRKKSHVQQIFIYIVAIILFSLMLAYGYRAVSEFRSKTDSVALLQMKNDIASAVKRVSSDYGTVVKKEIVAPVRYDSVCFVDIFESGIDYGSTGICTSGADDYLPVVCDSWGGGASYNMFLVSPDDTMTYNIGKIKIDNPYYFCADAINGKVTLKLEGKGDHVLLSEWPIT